MKTVQYVIQDELGIHARPAGELVKLAKTFSSHIIMKKEGKSGDCKKIFALMGLAVKKGNEITLEIEGEDEEKACEELTRFLKEQL